MKNNATEWLRVRAGYYMAKIDGQTWVIQRDRDTGLWWAGKKYRSTSAAKAYSATTLAGAKRIVEGGSGMQLATKHKKSDSYVKQLKRQLYEAGNKIELMEATIAALRGGRLKGEPDLRYQIGAMLRHTDKQKGSVCIEYRESLGPEEWFCVVEYRGETQCVGLGVTPFDAITDAHSRSVRS